METVTDGLKSNKDIDARLDTLIRSHTQIGQYVRDLDNLLAYPCLVEFLTFAMNILSLLFAVTTVIKIRYLSYLDRTLTLKRV